MKGKTCRKRVNELGILDSLKNLTPASATVSLPLPWSIIHVQDITIIFKDL